MIACAPGNADGSSLAARFIEGPFIAAPEKAEQRLADWLAELGPEAAGALAELLEVPFARRVLLGIDEFSP